MIPAFFGLAAATIGIGIALLVIGLQIYAIIDIIRSDFKNQNDKLIWILVVLFLHFLGALLYFIFAQKQTNYHYNR